MPARLAFLAALAAAAGSAAALDLNVISRVEVREEGGFMVVSIQGTKPPNFTTFSMLDPPRFVIDMSEAQFQGVPEDIAVGNETINLLKNLSYGSAETSIARVMLAFNREVEAPDVQTTGNALVVRVARPGAAPAPAARAEPPPSPAPAAPVAAAPAAAPPQDDAAAVAAERERQEKENQELLAFREAQRKAEEEAAARKKEEEARLEVTRLDELNRQKAEAEARARAEQEERDRAAAEAQEKVARARAEARGEPPPAAPAEQPGAEPTAAAPALPAPAPALPAPEPAAPAAAPAAEPPAPAAPVAAAPEAAPEPPPAAPAPERLAVVDTRGAPGERLVDDGRPRQVMEIGFQQMPERSRVFVKLSGAPRFEIQETDGDTVRVEFPNTRVRRHNDTRHLDTSFFPSPVSMVTPSREGSSYVVAIKLRQRVQWQQKVEGDVLAIDFERPESMRARPAAPAPESQPAAPVPAEPEAPAPAPPPPGN